MTSGEHWLIDLVTRRADPRADKRAPLVAGAGADGAHRRDQIADNTMGDAAPTAVGDAECVASAEHQSGAIRSVGTQRDRRVAADHAIGLRQSAGIGIAVNDVDAMDLPWNHAPRDALAGEPGMTLITVTLIAISDGAVRHLHSVR